MYLHCTKYLIHEKTTGINRFVFVWADKSIIAEVMQRFEELGYFYVENACWVMEDVNNTIARLPASGVARNSHETLLMLRKGRCGLYLSNLSIYLSTL